MVKETLLYEELCVETTVDENGLKRAYRKLALKYHPDKNQGDNDAAEKFKKIGHAYEVLSDPEKRAVYDKHGAKGLEQGGGGGGDHDASDIFSMFFGGGGRSRGEPKPKDIVHELAVTLEDMYSGKTKKIAATRDRYCGDCNAEGVKAGAQRIPCTDCGGRGVRIVMQQVFPGMVQRGQMACQACDATGQRVKPSDLCNTCQGRKIVKDKKILEVHVEKGMKKGDHIRFAGEGDQVPGIKLSGDILLVIDQKPHDTFRRIGSHLLMNHNITLQEALCGFELPIQHLDKRMILVKIPAGQVIDPNHAWTIHREGMPVPNTGGVERGNLVIHFDVEFPQSLPAGSIKKISEALNFTAIESSKDASAGELCSLSPFVPEPKRRGGRRQQQRRTADDDDDDDGPRGGAPQGAQCQQQ